MTVDETRLGERFRDRRKAKGKTQQAAAREIGVGPRTVQNFESGAATPQPANLRKMLRWAGLEREELPEGTELTERAWPKEVSVFLDVIAAYLMTFDEDERLRRIHAVTRQIFVSRHESES